MQPNRLKTEYARNRRPAGWRTGRGQRWRRERIRRTEQAYIWRGYATMGLSQNRFAYCINDPVNLYDHGGNRFDEGGASVARNMRNGMSAAAAVAKSNQSQAKVQSAANKAAETRAKRDYYWLNTSVNNYNEEQRAEQQSIRRADSAARAFNAALGGVDRSKLSGAQRQVVDAAEKELRDKAYDGTLSMEERNSIINEICSIASVSREKAAKEKVLESASKAIEDLVHYIETRNEFEPQDKKITFSAGIFRGFIATAVGTSTNYRAENKPDFNFIFGSLNNSIFTGTSAYFGNVFISSTSSASSLSFEFGVAEKSWGVTLKISNGSLDVSFDITQYRGSDYERVSYGITIDALLAIAILAAAKMGNGNASIPVPALG